MSLSDARRDCDACFRCAYCGKRVCTDWETALCACDDDPTCDDCCEAYHDKGVA